MNGILLINKPKDYTSHDIVAIVKKITGEKVGHTGTLDPNATGVLPLLIGKATGISKYLINHDKIYIATLKLGEKRDTADSEGKVIETKKVECITEEKVKRELSSIIGKQEQTPPIYSAIKIKGKKLYEYARSGKEIEIRPISAGVRLPVDRARAVGINVLRLVRFIYVGVLGVAIDRVGAEHDGSVQFHGVIVPENHLVALANFVRVKNHVEVS